MTEKAVLIMAAGTGGHIFPALSIAESLQRSGCTVHWLGTPEGMEADIVRRNGIPLHCVTVRGLRGKGVAGLLLAPFMVLRAMVQVLRVLRNVRPVCVLGMGGYVTGPGGAAAWLSRRPLVIHEQNAIAGFSNRLLRYIAAAVAESFPGTFGSSARAICTGNPVRADIEVLPAARPMAHGGPLRLLVLGGSRGAEAINNTVPLAVSAMKASGRPAVWHQAGRDKIAIARDNYLKADLALNDGCRVEPFIEDMEKAYDWADLVICRAGATTVAELAAAGLPSVLIPFPHAVDDHQTANARWLSQSGAAILLHQRDCSGEALAELLEHYTNNPGLLHGMADAARSLARPGAADRVASICMEVCRGDG
ncbi:MAG: undecaprenyldiphospho-muramoylpentapeptide beta-N-acetylglucosaminyltransferase [Pseudohongiellaceae bacterium]